MSPRAAWQLEAMGFTDVYGYVNGKVEWMLNRQQVDGTGPHYAMARGGEQGAPPNLCVGLHGR